jgi:hypothetical protein
LQRIAGVSLSRRALVRGAALATLPWLVSSPVPAWGALVRRSVRDHGARGNGKVKDTAAIQAAIDAAAGGIVYFPPGDYLSGTLRLRDRLTLLLAADATLVASPDDADFDPPEKLGYEAFADQETTDFAFALLQGRGVQHLQIVGPGRIDGNRRSRGGPKPIALKQCREVTIRDLTLENAPSYAISLLGCDHVDIHGVTIRNGYADGIDPDGCRYVRIAGCRVESRDDAICLKGSLALGIPRSTEHVVVTDCDLVNVRNGLKIGTETSGDFRDIVFRNCRMTARAEVWDPPPFGLRPFPSAGVSLQSVDGGRLEQVVVSNITMHGVRAPIFVRLAERGWGQPVPRAGTLAGITISGLVATGAEWTSSIIGLPGHDVADVALRDIRISHEGGGHGRLATRAVPEQRREYPDAARFRHLPAYGLYGRYVERLRLEDVEIGLGNPDARPALVLDGVREASVRRFAATAPADGGPVAWLRAARDCWLEGVRAPGAAALARLSGPETARIGILAAGAAEVVLLDPEVPAAALRLGGGATARRRTPSPDGDVAAGRGHGQPPQAD